MLTDDLPRADREARLSRADGFLRRALAADDRDAAIWRNLAEVSLARGDVGRAREYLAEARDRTSFGDAYALYQLGRISRDAGLWREAAFAWREAGAVAALQSWAQEARGRDQWDRASIALAALAEVRPSEPRGVPAACPGDAPDARRHARLPSTSWSGWQRRPRARRGRSWSWQPCTMSRENPQRRRPRAWKRSSAPRSTGR